MDSTYKSGLPKSTMIPGGHTMNGFWPNVLCLNGIDTAEQGGCNSRLKLARNITVLSHVFMSAEEISTNLPSRPIISIDDEHIPKRMGSPWSESEIQPCFHFRNRKIHNLPNESCSYRNRGTGTLTR